MLESPHNRPDLLCRLNTDVVKLHQFTIGNPAEIAKTVITSSEERRKHYRLEADLVIGQTLGVIEPYVHPGRSVQAAGTSDFTELPLLAEQKADLIRLLSHLQNRLSQCASGAKDFVAVVRLETTDGAGREPLSNLGVKFTGHVESPLFLCCQNTAL
jgi:hypothetical protein